MTALIQIVNCYSNLGDTDRARAAHRRALLRLEELPDEAFEAPDALLDRPAWERWLNRLRRRSVARTYYQQVQSLGVTLEDSPPLDEEIADYLKMSPSTARPRRIELVNAGLVVASDRRRPTRSGRMATVWVAVTGDAQMEML